MDEVYRSHVSSWLKLEVSIDRASFHSCNRCKSHAGMNHYVLFPFRGGALALWVVFTLAFDLAVHAGFLGIPLAIVLVSWLFKYCFVLLDAIITGASEPPVLSAEMVNPLSEQRPVGQALLIIGGVMLTLAVSRSLGTVSGWICGGLLLTLLPASIATMGLSSNILRAAWPPDLWSVIRGIGQRDYLILVSAIPGLAVVLVMLFQFGAPWLLSLAAAQVFLLLTFALVGSALHEHRLELGIEYRTLHERIAERTEREQESERNRVLVHAYMKFRVAKPAEDWQEIQTWLDSQRAGFDPNDRLLPEHRAVLAITSRWEDVRAADRLTNDLVELYFARRETGRALEVVEQRLASNPNYRPKHQAHAVRLAELAAAAGKRALRRQLLPDPDQTGS